MYPEQSPYPGQPQQPQPTQPYPAQPQPQAYPQQQPGYPSQPGYPQPGYPSPDQSQPGYPPQPPQPDYGSQQFPPQPGYQPAPDPTANWGNPAPVSGPQIGPGYGDQTGFAGPPAAPAGKSRRNTVMIVINAVLALALLATGGIVLATITGLRGDVDQLKDERAAQTAAAARAEAQLKDDFAKADLKSKLATVRELTTKAQQALTTWFANQQSVEIRTVQDAISKCDAAVFDYDATAARFPPAMLGDLPPRINLASTTTNCGQLR